MPTLVALGWDPKLIPIPVTVLSRTSEVIADAIALVVTWIRTRYQMRDVAERLPALVNATDYYPLLVIHVGARDIDSSSLRSIKKDYRALGEVVRGSGAQIVFSTIL